MKINIKKTETMKVSDDPSPINVHTNVTSLNEVHTFKNLRARFNTNATCEEEIKTRLELARDMMVGHISTIWQSRAIVPR